MLGQDTLDKLIGTGGSPGLVAKVGTLGERLGDTTASWVGLVGKAAAATAPAAPAPPPRADNATLPDKPGIVARVASLSVGTLFMGALALAFVIYVTVRGD